VKLRVVREITHNLAARDYGVAEQSHWMCYAIEAAYALTPDSALLAYADRIAGNILDRPHYKERPRCTPIACRSEGLLAYLRTLRRSGRADERRFAQVRDEIAINPALQLKDRLPDGAFCQGAGSSMVRIDFLQHNIAAFLGYSEIEKAKRAEA
jgi:hypothetical protein